MTELSRAAGGRRPGREIWLPLGVFLAITAIVFALWWVTRNQQSQRLRVETEVTASHVALRLEAWIKDRLSIVRYLSKDWRPEIVSSANLFRAGASVVLDLFPGFQAINWVDRGWVIRIIVPEKGNLPALDKDLHEHPAGGVAEAVARAERTGKLARTPIVELLQGGKGFATYAMVHDAAGRPAGFYNGVFRVDRLVNHCLSEKSLRRRFRYELHELDGTLVYRVNRGPAGKWPYQVELPLQVADMPWTLRIAPSQAFLAKATSAAGDITLMAGLLLALLVAWLVRKDLMRRRALTDSERRYRTLFDGAGDAIFLMRDDVFIDCNEKTCEMFGCRREDIVGRPPYFFSPERQPDGRDSTEKAKEKIRTAVSGGPISFEWQHCRKDKTPFDAEVTLNALEISGERLLMAMVRDVTERKRSAEERQRLTEQMRHVQKLESLGVLAGGIAHDFNNLLMVILGNADLALLDLAPASAAVGSIEEIKSASLKASDLCNQMLAYSGKGRFIVRAVDLNELIIDMGHLLQISISKKAYLKYDLARELPSVNADINQLRQVLMNLITNASEASGEQGGVITLASGVIDADRDYLSATFLDDGLPPGRYVCLEVSDTGCGMDDETMARIFDPFFSAKFAGRGLGMAAVLGIVRGHGGAIKIYSEVGKGTTFKILLPESGSRVESLAGRAPTLKPEWQGEGVVLVADDEPAVREVVEAMLAKLGFETVSAVDGAAAVEIFKKQRNEIVLVLLDMTMPRLSGEEAFCELRRIKQDVKVILCSGYNEQEATSRFTGKGLAGFLQKPYEFTKLRDAMHSVLDS